MDLKKRHEELSGHKEKPIELRQTIRISTLKLSKEEIINKLKQRGLRLTKIPFLKSGYGYYVDIVDESKRFSLGATQEYLQGYYYLQEAASQMPVEILDSKPGELVLDMCASPGGKTSQIAQFMENKGKIIALDIGFRINKLKNNLERMGVMNTIIYKRDAQFFELPENKKVDKILLDAPCSGNYTLDKEWYEKTDISKIKECAHLQKELTRSAQKNLKQGGVLVYSTCSLEPEEDEQIVQFAQTLGLKLEMQKRIWPHENKTSGFFIAKFRKV